MLSKNVIKIINIYVYPKKLQFAAYGQFVPVLNKNDDNKVRIRIKNVKILPTKTIKTFLLFKIFV